MHPSILFLPGGPGLTSRLEQNLIGNLWAQNSIDCDFWDFPSSESLSPNLINQNWFKLWQDLVINKLQEKNKKTLLVCSSFSCLGALFITQKHADLISGIVMISPALDIHQIHLKMIDLALKDFEISGNSLNSSRLRSMIKSEHHFFDSRQEEIMQIVYQDPILFDHYWRNKIVFQNWISLLSLKENEFDSRVQNKIFKDLSNNWKLKNTPIYLPIWLAFGNYDPVNSQKDVINFLLTHCGTQPTLTKVFSNSAHFPHLEEPEDFVSFLNNLPPIKSK